MMTPAINRLYLGRANGAGHREIESAHLIGPAASTFSAAPATRLIKPAIKSLERC
jgi:hypothetical protein